MALPVFYTESSLAAYMRDVLKSLAADLGWQSEPFSEPINDILIGYGQGVTQVSDCTDIPRLRVMARIAVWKAAEEATVGDYDTTSQQDTDKRSQIYPKAKEQRLLAQADLQKLLDDRAKEATDAADELRAIGTSSSNVPVIAGF